MNPVPGDITTRYSKAHPALDYAVGIGTSIKVPLGGVIESMAGAPTRYLGGNMTNKEHWAKYEDNPNGKHSGNVITVNHGDGVYTSYLHVSPYSASSMSGKKVRAGQIIGKTGHNGWSTGPHLHFEVWRNGVRIDPDKWLKLLEEDTLVTKDTANHYARMYKGRGATKNEISGWSKLTPDQLANRLRKSDDYRKRISAARKGGINPVNFLPEALREAYTPKSSPSTDKFKKLADRVKALLPFTK